MENSVEGFRAAILRGEVLSLFGRLPAPGERLLEAFTLPAARHARAPLTERDLSTGLVLLSTLPNIERHACVAQILHLDELAPRLLPQARVVHVSSDGAHHWCEVDRFHPTVRAASYTLAGADDPSSAGFKWAFGVGVIGHDRIAHGLFALEDGVFVAAQVPYDQMEAPPVAAFLQEVIRRRETP